MTIGPFTLLVNEEILQKAMRRAIRPKNQLVLWAKVNNEWEMWDFSITRWPQYLEAHYVYRCMLMREGLQNIVLALFPHGVPIPDSPENEISPLAKLKIGIFSDKYPQQRGF